MRQSPLVNAVQSKGEWFRKIRSAVWQIQFWKEIVVLIWLLTAPFLFHGNSQPSWLKAGYDIWSGSPEYQQLDIVTWDKISHLASEEFLPEGSGPFSKSNFIHDIWYLIGQPRISAADYCNLRQKIRHLASEEGSGPFLKKILGHDETLTTMCRSDFSCFIAVPSVTGTIVTDISKPWPVVNGTKIWGDQGEWVIF